MAKPLNFNTIKKQYWTITLPDKKKTTLMIGTPTGAILEELIAIQDTLSDVDESNITADDLKSLHIVCAKVMNRNKGGIVIKGEQLADIFDFEDIKIFMSEYMNFVSEVMSSKN